MFQRFIMQAFFLDLITLVHPFHGAQYAAPFGDAVKFRQYGLFHQVGEFFDQE